MPAVTAEIGNECKLTIDVTRTIPIPQYTTEKLRKYSQEVLDACVQDERNSAGGSIWVESRNAYGDVTDTIFDFADNTAGSGGQEDSHTA